MKLPHVLGQRAFMEEGRFATWVFTVEDLALTLHSNEIKFYL